MLSEVRFTMQKGDELLSRRVRDKLTSELIHHRRRGVHFQNTMREKWSARRSIREKNQVTSIHRTCIRHPTLFSVIDKVVERQNWHRVCTKGSQNIYHTEATHTYVQAQDIFISNVVSSTCTIGV